MAKLTEKQKRFVQEYLVDLNATAAAKRAGYSEKSASRIAVELLNKTQVSAEIQKQQAKRQKRVEITQEKVLEELAAIAFANGADFATVNQNGIVRITPTSELPDEKRKAIASIKEGQYGTEVKVHDKVKALELLAKHLGMFDSKNGGSEAPENNIFEVMIRKPPVVWTGWRALTSPPRPRASRRVMWPSPLLEPVMEPAALRPALMPCLQGSCARLRVRWRLFGG